MTAKIFGYLNSIAARLDLHHPLVVIAVLLLGGIVLGLALNRIFSMIFMAAVRKLGLDKDVEARDTKFLRKFAFLAIPMVFYFALPLIVDRGTTIFPLIMKGLALYAILVFAVTFDALLNLFLDVYRSKSRRKWILSNGIVQTLKIADFSVAVVLVLAVLFDKPVLYMVSGLGALTAVGILVFKDTLLGFVAGLQLSANKMIAHGDWIEMPKYDVDGEVIEVNLATVKVRNWDKTISMVPTYALISESFKNWRGMQESGGRRIKRAIHIDATTIRFVSPDDENSARRLPFGDELEAVLADSLRQGSEAGPFALTNAALFRQYAEIWLKHHRHINQSMTLMVRELSPAESGLPVEIYAFCIVTEWVAYEKIQADIFDHLIALIPLFGLRLFQNPSGSDFREYLRIETAGMAPEDARRKRL